MNEICKAQYSNKTLGVEARSINLLDMEKHLKPDGITARNAYKYSNDTANMERQKHIQVTQNIQAYMQDKREQE